MVCFIGFMMFSPFSINYRAVCMLLIELQAAFEAPQLHVDGPRRVPGTILARTTNIYQLQVGALVLATDYLRAQRLRSALRSEMATLLKGVDALLTPTTRTPWSRLSAPSALVSAIKPAFAMLPLM